MTLTHLDSPVLKPHKFRVLHSVSRGTMPVREASALLNTSPRAIQQMLTIWKPKLEPVVGLIDDLLVPTNTKKEQTKLKESIANTLEITYRQVNRLLKLSKIHPPTPKSIENREKTRENAQKSREINVKYAIDVISGGVDVQTASESCGLSARQMYRVCGTLSQEILGVKFKVLRSMDANLRCKLARQIEEALHV